MSSYAIITRSYLGSVKSVITAVESKEELDAAIETIKDGTQSDLVSFDIYMHKESFTKKLIWSN